jgi:hypothetical protein
MRDCRGQNPLDWGFFWFFKEFIKKLLECRCPRWACMTHLNTSNTNHSQKKGRESNWRFDSRPQKVGNRLNFLACKRRARYRWKALDEGYNFALDLIANRGMHTKLWASKVTGIPTLGQNDIWVLVMWASIEYTIRGKVVASPKSKVWWVLWICVCSWLVHAPKCSNYAPTTLFFGLCRFVWVIELLVNLPKSHPRAPAHPSTPEVQRAKECAQLLLLPLSSPLDLQLSPSRNLGVHIN